MRLAEQDKWHGFIVYSSHERIDFPYFCFYKNCHSLNSACCQLVVQYIDPLVMVVVYFLWSCFYICNIDYCFSRVGLVCLGSVCVYILKNIQYKELSDTCESCRAESFSCFRLLSHPVEHPAFRAQHFDRNTSGSVS